MTLEEINDCLIKNLPKKEAEEISLALETACKLSDICLEAYDLTDPDLCAANIQAKIFRGIVEKSMKVKGDGHP